jgi:hypothetical protein
VSLPRWVDARWNTSGGNEAYIILHRGARSRGYKRRERERERERERGRERVRSCGEVPELASAASLLLSLPPLVPFSLRAFVRVSRARAPLHPRRKALDVPFYRYKEMAQLYNGV